MINIKEEDTKLFEQNGFTKEDVENTVNHYRQQGLSDDKIQKKINIRISSWKNPESFTSYMQIANNPNISPEEKQARLNALKSYEDEHNSVENLIKRQGEQELDKIKQNEYAHPFRTGMRSMFDPTYNANKHYLNELAQTGKTTLSGYIQRGGMGGLTALGDALTIIPGVKEAQTLRAAKAANDLKKLSTASKMAASAKTGGNKFCFSRSCKFCKQGYK